MNNIGHLKLIWKEEHKFLHSCKRSSWKLIQASSYRNRKTKKAFCRFRAWLHLLCAACCRRDEISLALETFFIVRSETCVFPLTSCIIVYGCFPETGTPFSIRVESIPLDRFDDNKSLRVSLYISNTEAYKYLTKFLIIVSPYLFNIIMHLLKISILTCILNVHPWSFRDWLISNICSRERGINPFRSGASGLPIIV